MNEFKENSIIDAEEFTPTRQAAAKKSTWISVITNVSLTVVQLVTGFVTNSQGLLADGVHTLSDLVADFVVLLAIHHSQKEPDKKHHYGHKRYENAASLILGVILLAVGFGMIWAAVQKLSLPETINTVNLTALWVAIGALIAKELLFRYMLAVAERVRSSMLVANAWHARSDAASSLVVAIGIGGNLLGYPLMDPIAALIVGFMVSKMGGVFCLDALHDLTDRAATDEEMTAIENDLRSVPGVLGLHDLRTRKTGDMLHVDVHLEVDGNLKISEGHDIAQRAHKMALQNHPILTFMIHVDPIIKRNKK